MTAVPRTKASGGRGAGQTILAAALCLLIAGCTVGPNYKRPDAPVPPAYKENNGTQATVPPPNPAGRNVEDRSASRRRSARQVVGAVWRFSVECARRQGRCLEPNPQGRGRAISGRARPGEGQPRRLLSNSFGRPVDLPKPGIAKSSTPRGWHQSGLWRFCRRRSGVVGARSVGKRSPQRRGRAFQRASQRRRSRQRGTQHSRRAGHRLLRNARSRHRPEAARRHRQELPHQLRSDRRIARRAESRPSPTSRSPRLNCSRPSRRASM